MALEIIFVTIKLGRVLHSIDLGVSMAGSGAMERPL